MKKMKRTVIFILAILASLLTVSAGLAEAFPPDTAYPVYGSFMCFDKPDLNGAVREIQAKAMKVLSYKETNEGMWLYGSVGNGKFWVPATELWYSSDAASIKKAGALKPRLMKAMDEFFAGKNRDDGSWMLCPDVPKHDGGTYNTWTRKDAIVQSGMFCGCRSNEMCERFLGLKPIGLSRAELTKLMGAPGGWEAPDRAVYEVPDTDNEQFFFRLSNGRVVEAGWSCAAPSDADASWPGWRLWDLRVYRGDIPDCWPASEACLGSNVNIRKAPSRLSPAIGKIGFKGMAMNVYRSVKRGVERWTLVEGGIGLRGWMFGKYVEESTYRSSRKRRFEAAFDSVFSNLEVYLANIYGEMEPFKTEEGKADKGYLKTVYTWKKSRKTIVHDVNDFEAFIADVTITAPGMDVCGMQVGDLVNTAKGWTDYFAEFVGDLESCGWKREKTENIDELKWVKGHYHFVVTLDEGGGSIKSMSWGEAY